jgi:tetratricopeptide (TPR) repeat protein
MNRLNKFSLTAFLFLISCLIANGQIEEICASAGLNPSLDSPFAHVPYIYGKVTLKDWDPAAKFPKVTVIYADSQQSREIIILEKNGYFCFKRKSSSGGLIVEVDGIEIAQRTIPSFGTAQQREDFEIYINQKNQLAPPEVISAQFYYPPNPKTVELYKKVAELETKNEAKKTIEYLKEIVAIDSLDYIAWAKLGVLYFSQNSFTEADAAFRKCLELKIEFTPAWINVGKMRVVQKQFAAAIEIFKHALELEPKSAAIYRLLGETFLRNKQGTLGAEALNKAIELDPNGMAECHLLLAHLYELAKVNKLAAQEYKLFLKKVPDYKDKKRLEEFIKNNPE